MSSCTRFVMTNNESTFSTLVILDEGAQENKDKEKTRENCAIVHVEDSWSGLPLPCLENTSTQMNMNIQHHDSALSKVLTHPSHAYPTHAYPTARVTRLSS